MDFLTENSQLGEIQVITTAGAHPTMTFDDMDRVCLSVLLAVHKNLEEKRSDEHFVYKQVQKTG